MRLVQWMLAAALLATLAHGQAVRLKPWEEAVVNALKAINSGNADLYLAWAHPAEQDRLKHKFLLKVLTPMPGVSIEEQLKPYGVKTVEELSRMPETAFVAVAIPQQYAANDEISRAAMARTTFTVVQTVPAEQDVYEVHVALHVPLPGQPLNKTLVALAVKDEAGNWKYSGLR